MQIVKIVLIVIAVLIAIPLIIAAFVPNDLTVERNVVINKPKDTVFDYVKLVRNQENFSVWNMSDPNKKTTATGTDGTVGFVYTWDSPNKNTGAGAQEIKNIVPGQQIDYELRFERPMKNVAKSYLATTDVAPGQTQVKWAFISRNPYPMNFMNLFMDKMLGKDMDKSLNNLKSVLEKQ